MKKPRVRAVLATIVGLAGCGGRSVTSAPTPSGDLPPGLDAIREEDMRQDLYALAGDHFRGREAGTLDELKASAWLAERDRQAELEPAGDDGTYFQFWSLARVRLSTGSSIAVGSTRFPLGSDAVVISLKTAIVDAPIVQGGDGRSLSAADVAGKAVVVQITKPAASFAPDVSLRATRYALAAISERAAAIAPLGPAAIIMVSDAVADSGWGFVSTWFRNGSFGLEYGASFLGPAPAVPVIWLHQSALSGLQASNQRLSATLLFEQFLYPSVNVIARVQGTDPVLNKEYVLFSAHQDHDGIKPPVAGDSIWNGADDNGSTSVGILGIGRAFVKHPAKRSALFVWHGAEEKGLLGSRYHALHPVVPKQSIVAVINADMIGSNHPDSAALLGVQPPHRNSADLVAMAYRANALVSKFVVDTLWDRPSHAEGWYFRSDHVPYAQQGIPALYFSSLPHPLYHTPKDEPDKINYSKLTRIAKWMYATGWFAANARDRVKLDPGLKTQADSPR
ncbi:MAG: M28 family peptidase [Gemmatimonadota bacterium]